MNSALAATYTHFGGNNYRYENIDDSSFTGLQNESYFIEDLTETPIKLPFVADFDNDGDNEILIVYECGFEIRSSGDLTNVEASEFWVCFEPIPRKVLTYDVAEITGDDFLDIIFVLNTHSRADPQAGVEAGNVSIQTWDGTNLNNTAVRTSGGANTVGDDAFIETYIPYDVKCDPDRDLCVLVSFTDGPGNNFITVGVFDSTIYNNLTSIWTNVDGTQTVCAPRDFKMEMVDYDNDGEVEWIFGGLYTENPDANEYVYIYKLSVNSSDKNYTVTTEMNPTHELTYGLTGELALLDDECHVGNANSRLISNTVTTSIDGKNPDRMETFIAVAFNEAGCDYSPCDEYYFGIVAFDWSSNTARDTYPESGILASLDRSFMGSGIGNAFSGWYTGHTTLTFPLNDMCFTLYNSTLDEHFTIICANTQFPSGINQQKEYIIANVSATDLTLNSKVYNTVTHSINSNTTSILDEFLTPFGIYAITGEEIAKVLPRYSIPDLFGLATGLGTQTTTLEFRPSISIFDYSVISVDVDGTTEDLLIYDDDILYHVKGSAFNYACDHTNNRCITDYVISPDIENYFICGNETPTVSMIVRDRDSDKVSAAIVAYANTTNEQSINWSFNKTSPSTFLFNFEANVTGNNFNLLLYASDDKNPTKWSIIPLTFSVGNEESCHDAGESTLVFSQSNTGEEEEKEFYEEDMDENTNIIATQAKWLSGYTGLSVKILVLVIALIVGVSVSIYTLQTGLPITTASALGVATGIGVVLFGAIFGFISSAWIIVPLIIGTGGFALFTFVFRPSQGGG